MAEAHMLSIDVAKRSFQVAVKGKKPPEHIGADINPERDKSNTL